MDIKLIKNNFTSGRIVDGVQQHIDYIILHTEADSRGPSVEPILAWWNNPIAKASAHYMVQQDGEVVQAVLEKDSAWHADNWFVNVRSIGVEHEDEGNPKDSVRTDILYERSAELVADICQRYYIPCKLVGVDKKFIPLQPGIVLHRQVAIHGTSCPGELNCNRIIEQAQKILYKEISQS